VKTKEIKGTIVVGNDEHELVNTLYLCPRCDRWANSLKWSFVFNPTKPTRYKCPHCEQWIYEKEK